MHKIRILNLLQRFQKKKYLLELKIMISIIGGHLKIMSEYTVTKNAKNNINK